MESMACAFPVKPGKAHMEGPGQGVSGGALQRVPGFPPSLGSHGQSPVFSPHVAGGSGGHLPGGA